MSNVLDLVRNSPFGGPVTHAKCEGLKINDHRTVAALAASSGGGAKVDHILSGFVHVSEVNSLKCRLLSFAVQGQAILCRRSD